MIRQSQSNDLDSSADLTLQSEVSPTIVLHRTDKEPWESVSSISRNDREIECGCL